MPSYLNTMLPILAVIGSLGPFLVSLAARTPAPILDFSLVAPEKTADNDFPIATPYHSSRRTSCAIRNGFSTPLRMANYFG
ncbi:hypothetical protein GGI43DRAFT_419353 [Trichoderma evansii]